MTTYSVNKVRKQWAADKSHQHIIGVVTVANIFYTNKEVTDSLAAGNEWFTDVSGVPRAKIHKVSYCAATSCLHAPYLTTAPDSTTANNLENLPPG